MARSSKDSLLAGAAAERSLKAFIAKFSPKDQTRIRAVRRAMRQSLRGAFELVYDNYNFFVIGYSATERPSDAVISIAAQADRIALCFLQGAKLPDPAGILRGGGRQVRSIRLNSADEIRRPELQSLIREAVARGVGPLPAGRAQLIIRSVSAKQRPRRKAVRGTA